MDEAGTPIMMADADSDDDDEDEIQSKRGSLKALVGRVQVNNSFLGQA